MQTISSAKTSINQVPALHKKIITNLKGNVLDYGCGKYDTGKLWLENNNKNINVWCYDPYNRSKIENNKIIDKFDFVICSNVLNVIKEKMERKKLINDILQKLNKGGCAFFSIYNAKKSKNYRETKDFYGQPTTKGWQNCQPLSFYYDEINEIVECDMNKHYISI